MSYSQDKFYTRHTHLAGAANDFGTATANSATGADTTVAVNRMPTFFQRSKIHGFKLVCTTIPDDGSTALVVHLMNGTDTIGTAVVTTATAGQTIAGVITTAANGVFAAGGQPSFKLTGTATASGDSQGDYDVFFDLETKFAQPSA